MILAIVLKQFHARFPTCDDLFYRDRTQLRLKRMVGTTNRRDQLSFASRIRLTTGCSRSLGEGKIGETRSGIETWRIGNASVICVKPAYARRSLLFQPSFGFDFTFLHWLLVTDCKSAKNPLDISLH